MLPSLAITAVALAPGGAHPSYAHGYYDRDNAFYVAWDAISRDRERVRGLDARHVLETRDVGTTAQPARRRRPVTTTAAGYSADEMMAVAAARRLRDGTVCFVGHRAAEPRRQPRARHACAQAAC